MLLLFSTTLVASFFDSLNPSAIAQQLLLQAMVKNKRHILFFIFGIGLANMLLGLAIYYGVVTWLSRSLSSAALAYPLFVYGTEMCLGIACGLIGAKLIVKTVRLRGAENDGDSVKTPASLSPMSLFIMGAVFCAVELTSAMPYFGFLAMLAAHDLKFPLILAFVLLYCVGYVFPLILIYFGYNRLRGTTAILKLERVLTKISSYIVPCALSLLGVLMVVHGMHSLLNIWQYAF